jgi:2-dehydro-3-deoxyphosphogluconate aldolase/(4S)-4-hydroxy-2-oxoglutarate aldolase
MDRTAVFRRIKQVGIIPAMRTSDPVQAVRACEAICEGGIPIIEVSFASLHAIDVLEAVVKAQGTDMIVGAGTIVDAEEARLAAEIGAQFIVTPGFSAEAVAACVERSLAIFAGAVTPTEVQVVSRSGADAVKLFPCYSMGGPRYVRSLCGQYPRIEFIASGGVNLQNCADYVRAGACAVGVGGDIVDVESMAAGDHRVFTLRAKRFRESMINARLIWEPSHSINTGEGR